MSIERKKVKPHDFGEPTISWQLKEVQAPPMPNKDLHNPSTMTIIKSKIAQWAIGMLATIPEHMLWDIIKKALDRIEAKISTYPKWVQMAYVLLDNLLDAVDPRSPGGRAITKDFKKIIDDFWG